MSSSEGSSCNSVCFSGTGFNRFSSECSVYSWLVYCTCHAVGFITIHNSPGICQCPCVTTSRRGTKTPVQCGHRTMQISCDPFIQYICNLLYLILHVCTVKVLLWQKEKREMTMVHLIFPIPFFLNLVTRITWKNSTMAAFPHSMRVRKSKKNSKLSIRRIFVSIGR